MNQNEDQGSINYSNVKYSFSCVRRHLLRDKLYHVHAIADMIIIGETFNDPRPKYKIELNLKNTIYWKQEHGHNKAFGIKYKKNVKYFEASQEQLLKFRQAIACHISFNALDEHYKIEELIGKGSFSSVYKIERTADKKIFAMKYVSSKQKDKETENMSLLQNEISILHYLNSDQILKIHEVYRVEEYHYGIITEFVEGVCLATIIDQLKKNQNKLKEQEIKQMMQSLLRALDYIHSQKVIHRDIKPQNIMVQQHNYKVVKLIDFGLSIRNQLQYNRCGTPGYMAPEIVNMKREKDQQKPWTQFCDIFSLGVVFFKLLSQGVSCFQGQTSEQVLANNKRCQIDWSLASQYGYSKHCIALLKSMLEKDPEERISAIDALQHPFFSDLPTVQAHEIVGQSMTLNLSKKQYQTTNLETKMRDNDSVLSIDANMQIRQPLYKLIARPSIIMSGLVDKRQAFQVREEIVDTQTWEYLRENKIKSIKELLEQGQLKINDEIIQASGQTLLHQSIVINRYEIFLLCMLYQANVNQKTDEGMAPIHLAASLGRDKMIIELLKRGAEINLKDGIGMTALQRAQLYDHEETVELLKQYQ